MKKLNEWIKTKIEFRKNGESWGSLLNEASKATTTQLTNKCELKYTPLITFLCLHSLRNIILYVHVFVVHIYFFNFFFLNFRSEKKII
jgi:hypothetical protein